ncbi:hypothetical protein [Microcoleus sp. OTE_8_concoct_300]|uniref:hypothetical protein n=1 Tax=Microcoleus sp. OTE_8_concoct_300 TaxID=2964710 RepID=UPI00403F5241
MLLQTEYPIVVEREFNRNLIVRGFGRTADEAAKKVFESAREYGYWDAKAAYPLVASNSASAKETKSEEAPKPGSGRR